MLAKLKTKLYNFLRWSEKYTKTDMVYLASGGFWLTLGYGINIIKGLTISVLMANLFPKESYGYYKFILSIFSLVGIFSLSGMSTAIIQSTARDLDGIFDKAIKVVRRWSWLGSLSLLAAALYYFTKNNLNFTWTFISLAFLFPWYSTSGYYGAILAGKKKFDIQTKYYITYSAITFISIVSAIIITHNVFWTIFILVLSDVIVGNILTTISAKNFLQNKNIDPESIKYGFHLSLIGIINTIAQNIDKIIIPILLNYQELAIYSIALVIPEQIKGLLKILGSLALPKFSNRPIEQIKKTITKKTIITAILISILTVTYILVTPFIYKIFFPQYSESVMLSQIFALSLITAANQLPYSALQATKSQKKLYLYNTITSILNIILLLIFIINFKLMGIVIARVISKFASLGLALWLIKK